MNLLEKHRDDYKSLKKKELYKIIEEQLEINRKKIEGNRYNPLVSVRNNNRRSLRKFFPKRNKSKVARAKVYEKIEALRNLKKKGV